ncbi:hypothetical protein F5890DRAFT_1478859 [Lentinula detonsa]|uniref:Uncharacterized protein n=1 Tax=Lentinula detonsa TaxID=2804962 RepID=A0AA38UM29_9AGAR|nr:hypothetical protein F5890DRAFT_1478859 [Lentinula detonsa]
MACQHESPFQKRFIFNWLVLRGGLALVPHKFGDLKIAESIDDGLLRTFLQYPNADALPSHLPPSLSWSFTSGETVIYVPEGTELQDVVKGDEGVIERDESLECQTGIITKVRLDEVDVWITGINSICTIHPNSVQEVVESSVSPGLESCFQPRLSNQLKVSFLVQSIGQIPWMHVEVKPISGEQKGYLGRVYNVKSEWKNTKSGLLVLIRFQTPSLVGNLDKWYDYDHLQWADNGGFIHESTFTKKISSYFNFSKGYIPRHREDELPVTNLSTDPTNADGSQTPKSHWTAIDYSVPAWDPSSCTPNPYASSSSLTMSTPPAKHWILDS